MHAPLPYTVDMSTSSGGGGRRPRRRRARPADIAALLSGGAPTGTPAFEYVPSTLPGPEDPYGLADAVARLTTPRVESHGPFSVSISKDHVVVAVSDPSCRLAILEGANALRESAAATDSALNEDVAGFLEGVAALPDESDELYLSKLDDLHVHDAEALIALHGPLNLWYSRRHDRDVGLLITWLELAPLFLDQ
jgi:hypothetical protein